MLDARRSTGTYSSTASTSAVRPALEMAVPAFIAHSAYTGSPPNRLLLAVSHQRTSARVRRDPKRPRVAEQRYFSLSLDGGNDEEGGANGRTWDEPTLEETFDAIDDVIMGRKPGEGRDKVKVFGAWLDADVAGRKAGQGNRAAGLIARAERGEKLTNQEKAEVFYEEAIMLMKEGDYDASYTLLEKAVSLTGEDSRRGGEFKLWAVQALQGVGRDEQAVKLLKSLKTHRDSDVRKVSAELLYIAEAPRLALNDDDFVTFPDVSHLGETFDKAKWKELAKPKVAPWKKEDKEDKGYYVGRDTGQAPGNDPVMLVACVGAILALSYAFLG